MFFNSYIINNNSFSNDQFNFNVTELEITENGNKVKGFKRGTITTDDGIKFDADEFDYKDVDFTFTNKKPNDYNIQFLGDVMLNRHKNKLWNVYDLIFVKGNRIQLE